ncbi:hypothetical protein CsatB_000046 [Cannabis sativa]|uniref:protein GRAVITROPIC IN THE LIGHT 1 n=1 Tax=Cannabis sativa TaxID=3483 RepID=UPI0029CA82B5|nr:protein GRAVITROPIC IN THE LIGHT 1 [Cannabis sativa]XP_030480688.2 protein GRAVITROPIC IN THE LIGHT 1 [Cannabis sativa]XP_030480689.2 protein GRAVITROPIC IN THE LIGHT 1 [Cannabis sativa]
MDSMKPSKNKLARTLAKVLHFRTGIAPVDSGIEKVGIEIKKKGDKDDRNDEEEEGEESLAMEAFLAKLFASISCVKCCYAQLQFCQSPYDVDGIQMADRMVVSELKNLSELKRCYLKKQFEDDPSPRTSLVLAEIQEQKSLLKTYEITAKKLENQARLKDSEAIFLREKLDEVNKQNKEFEKKLNQSGQVLSVLDNLHFSGLNPSHFIAVLRHSVRSIRSFVRVMIEEMKTANWDFNAAAYAIQPEIVYWREEHKVFAFESFVSREMFDGFCYPNFVLSKEQCLTSTTRQKERFFSRFTEVKSSKTKEFLCKKPKSSFANFCRLKYLKLIHPKMEVSFFGDQSFRNLIQNSNGEFPMFDSSTFLASFFEMAKRVWLLHCLAFSFEPQASIFQVKKGCRFSEVYMESIAEEVFPLSQNDMSFCSSQESDSNVAFTVIPGFKIGKTLIQSKVYLSQILH